MADLLYNDSWAGLIHEYDQLDDQKFVVRTRGDVQTVLDANRHDANHENPWSPSRDLKHVARIPVEVYMIWLNELGIDALNKDHQPAVRKLLNDSQWSYLRSSGGTL
jgi:hypothetical protein